VKKKTAKKFASSCYDKEFIRLPIVLSLFVAFIILVLSLLTLLDNQRNLTTKARAEQNRMLEKTLRR